MRELTKDSLCKAIAKLPIAPAPADIAQLSEHELDLVTGAGCIGVFTTSTTKNGTVQTKCIGISW
jgi:hypothetical protein